MNESVKTAESRKYKNKQAYTDAAIKVVLSEGLEKFSLRKVADALGVSPMAMYKHFPNKESLLSSALDEFIRNAEVLPQDAGEMPWQDWVSFVATRMYEALAGEIVWTSALGAFHLGEQALVVTEAFVNKLLASGFSHQEAVSAYLLVIQNVVGAASLSQSLAIPMTDQQQENVQSLFSDNEDKEHLLRFFSDTFAENFKQSLPLIIKAIERVPS